MKQMWTPWRMEYILSAKRDGCILCDIAQSDDDRASLVLHRGQHNYLVLNKYPYNNGHLMAVPYHHVESLEMLSSEVQAELMAFLGLGIRVLKEASRPEGFNVGFNIGQVAGAGVRDHVHGHVVPRWGGDTNFIPVLADVRLIPESLEQTYDQLKAALERVLAA